MRLSMLVGWQLTAQVVKKSKFAGISLATV